MLILCPCNSGKPYSKCCKILHDGAYAKNALELMRSRYTAYAYHKPDYIIRTTHPDSPHFQQDSDKWKTEILIFCQNTQFQGLKIIEFIDGKTEAYVTFLAQLRQQERDASFVEKSRFEKVEGRWLYHDGLHTPT